MKRIILFCTVSALASLMMTASSIAQTPIVHVLQNQGFWRMHVETQINGASRSHIVRDTDQCLNLRPQPQSPQPSNATCRQLDLHASTTSLQFNFDCDTQKNGRVIIRTNVTTRDDGRTATLQTHFAADSMNVNGIGPAAVTVETRGRYLGACPAGTQAFSPLHAQQAVSHYTDAERLLLHENAHNH
jgi:hypothetical protein